MLISLSSLYSKISPHSRHSTNSASSSRLTIRTRGCLQGCFLSALCGGEGDFAVINPEVSSKSRRGRFAGISRYFRPAWRVVKPLPTECGGFLDNFGKALLGLTCDCRLEV